MQQPSIASATSSAGPIAPEGPGCLLWQTGSAHKPARTCMQRPIRRSEMATMRPAWWSSRCGRHLCSDPHHACVTFHVRGFGRSPG